MRRKRIIALLLSAALVLSLAGCRKQSEETAQSLEISESTVSEESAQGAGEGKTGSSEAAAREMKETEETKENGGKTMTPWLNTNVAGTVTEDTAVNLKDDFYLAVNYDFLKDTRLREGRVWEGAFVGTEDLVEERLIKLMTDDTLEGHDARLIQDFYAMWMDWDTRNSVGMTGLLPQIEIIRQIGTLEELTGFLTSEEGLAYCAWLGRMGLRADMEDASWYCLHIGSTVLSLGDSDEYRNLTSVGERSLKAYREEVGLLLEKAGFAEEEAEEIMDRAYAFEEDIASAMMSTAEWYGADAMERSRNRVTMEELEELSPHYPLTEIMKELGLEGSERINLEEPRWLSKINELYTEENLENIKSYLLAHTLYDLRWCLDQETYDEMTEIEREKMGRTGTRTDEEMAIDAVEDFLPVSISKVYVKEYISEEARNDITALINDSIGAYRRMLSSEDWLSDETKEKVLEKLDHITVNVAYPDRWQDTEVLQLVPKEEGGDYFSAVTDILAYEIEQQKKLVNTKIDREAWADDMLLTEANTYYDSSDNSINIIAGILGGDFYAPEMTREEKLAGIGFLIGHEISHAFDTAGAQYDKDGNFADWWTEADYAAFEARAGKLIAYYDQIVPFDGKDNYPGSNVQGEAIADMAGLKCMLLLAEEDENFDYDAFFRAYAADWSGIYSRAYCEELVYQDPHPMEYLRVNITLMQQPEFYETYDIKEGDGMYMNEKDRISVW